MRKNDFCIGQSRTTADKKEMEDVSPSVLSQCDQVYSSELEQRICYRVNLAALNMLTAYNNEHEVFSFENRFSDLKEKGIAHLHPSKQCRLDTLRAGSFCPLSPAAMPSDADPLVSYCEDSLLARRPRCWYNP